MLVRPAGRATAGTQWRPTGRIAESSGLGKSHGKSTVSEGRAHDEIDPLAVVTHYQGDDLVQSRVRAGSVGNILSQNSLSSQSPRRRRRRAPLGAPGPLHRLCLLHSHRQQSMLPHASLDGTSRDAQPAGATGREFLVQRTFTCIHLPYTCIHLFGNGSHTS